MKFTRVTSIILAVAILFSTIVCTVGCNKKDADGKGVSNVIVNEVEKVSADSLWFDYSEKELTFVDNPDLYLYYNIESFFSTGDGYVALLVGTLKSNFENISKVLVYNDDLELINTLDITTDMLGVGEGTSIYVSNLTMVDGNPCALVNTYYFDENTYDFDNKTFLFDIDANELANIDYLKEKVGDSGTMESFGASSSGYVYATITTQGMITTYDIIFGKDGSIVKSFDVSQLVGREDVWGCNYLNEDDEIIYFECYGDDYTKYLEIDTSNFSAKVNDTYEENVSFVNKFNHSTLEVDDKVYSMSQEAILCDGEVVMPYSATYAVSFDFLYNSQLLFASDDKFVVLSKRLTDLIYITYTAYTFDRAESNPNVGKTILTAGYLSRGGMENYTANAISVFNQTNENYFVKAVEYKINDEYDHGEGFDESDYNKYYLGQEDQAANKMMLDILSGEGPDIILDTFNWAQLNSEEYLYDLYDVLNEIDVEVFDNVMEAAKIDGKLYQMPLSFNLKGMFADKWKIKGESGFTFEEYAEYVDKGCNGHNPIYYGKVEFLTTCMASMREKFFDEDGNVSFQNDAFYELAEYCLNNVQEKTAYPWDSQEYNDNTLYYTNFSSIHDYLELIKSRGSVGFYGAPSVDGRGPSIGVFSSFAISAGACDYEGAKEFLKIFFEADLDCIWKDAYYIPVVVAASDLLSKQGVDLSNSNYDCDLQNNTEEELMLMGLKRLEYDVIEDYNDILRSASTISYMDSSIKLIVMEEIPAYFAGQKSIEDVAVIIENRAQTVIDERS